LYAAKSTADDKGSIKDQHAALREMASRPENQWEVRPEWEFSDEDKSAYHSDRGVGLANAIALSESLAQERGGCVLAVWHSNRLARGPGDAPDAPRHLIEIVFWARRHLVELRSVCDDVTFQHPMIGYMMGEMNHQESAIKSVNVKRGMKRRAEQRALPNGGPAGYGFEYQLYVERNLKTGKDESVRRRVHHPVEAPIVRRIFKEFAGEKSQSQITRDLNADGIPSHRGKTWFQGSISKLLRCNLIVGRFTFDGKEYQADPKEIPPIIDLDVPEDRALWKAVQDRLAENVDSGAVEQVAQLDKSGQPVLNNQGQPVTRPRVITKGRGRNPRGSFVFVKGMLRCSCGSAMNPVTKQTRTPGVRHEVYACQGRKTHGLASCSQVPVKRALIDTAVVEFYQRVALDMDGTRATIAAAHGRELASLAALRIQADRGAAKAEERLARVKRDYLDGALPVADWQALREELTAELEAAHAKAELLAVHTASITAQTAEFDVESELLRRLAAFNAEIGGRLKEGARLGPDGLRAALRGTGIDHFVLVKAGVFYSGLQGALPSTDDEGFSRCWPRPAVTSATQLWTSATLK